MRAEDIRDLLKRQPFVPFRIHMTDGKSYDVMHPELVLLTKSYLHIAVSFDPESGVPDRTDFCALLHIVRVEELRRETSQPSN